MIVTIMSILRTPVIYNEPLTDLNEVGSLRVRDEVKQIINFPVAEQQEVVGGKTAQGKFLSGNPVNALSLDRDTGFDDLKVVADGIILPPARSDIYYFDYSYHHLLIFPSGWFPPTETKWRDRYEGDWIILEQGICHFIAYNGDEILVANSGGNSLKYWVWTL